MLFDLKLGERTDTSDAEGQIVETREVKVKTPEILTALEQFRGDILQVPTMFSALKHNGKPPYEYARQGITVEREARPIRPDMGIQRYQHSNPNQAMWKISSSCRIQASYLHQQAMKPITKSRLKTHIQVFRRPFMLQIPRYCRLCSSEMPAAQPVLGSLLSLTTPELNERVVRLENLYSVLNASCL